MSQLICCSKNSITSQNKQYEAHDSAYSFSICVLNEACDLSAVRMQLSTLIHSQFDIIHSLILLVGLISSAVWYHPQFDINRSLILCAIWYCLHSFILFFLFNLNCASTSLYIFRLKHTFLILYFLSLYSHWEWWLFFQKRHLLWIWFQQPDYLTLAVS